MRVLDDANSAALALGARESRFNSPCDPFSLTHKRQFMGACDANVPLSRH